MNSKNFASIAFDASISDCGIVGIGIHDIKRKDTVGRTYNSPLKSNNSYHGEKAALLFSMEYAFHKLYTHINFFTDNKSLADNGIPLNFLKKFPFESCNLNWIPRELNKDADKVSKRYRKNGDTDYISSPKIQNTQEAQRLFSKYSYDTKVAFIKKHFSKSINPITDKQNSEFLRMLVLGEKGNYSFNNSKAIVPILSITKLMFSPEEHPPYVRKRIKGVKLDGKTLIKPMSLERFKDLK